MENYIDLHMHSAYSDDGEFTPAQLVFLCKKAGIKLMSVTDHNSVKANSEARIEAEKLGIEYISGIEIDCTFDGLNLHLLGYGIDECSPDFEELERSIFSGEQKASVERFSLTRRLGFTLSEAELNAISNIEDGTGVWSGEVFAEVLLEKEELAHSELLLPYRAGGQRADNPYVNFYWDYYSQGKPCYAKVDFPKIEEAAAMVHNNGGIAVLAHPGNNLRGRFELFDEVVKTGIDGVEVFCSYHDEKTAQYFYERALTHSLLFSCGSDFHGKTKPSVKLGESGCRIESRVIACQFKGL